MVNKHTFNRNINLCTTPTSKQGKFNIIYILFQYYMTSDVNRCQDKKTTLTLTVTITNLKEIVRIENSNILLFLPILLCDV